MADRTTNGKKGAEPTTLDLMGDDVPAPRPKAARPAPKAAPAPAPAAEGGASALFGGDDVDLSAKLPADVPVGNFPAPSQIAAITEEDPFAEGGAPAGEEDPFADTPMAQMLADEPPPLLSPLRAAREQLNAPENTSIIFAATDAPDPAPTEDATPLLEAEESPMAAETTAAPVIEPPASNNGATAPDGGAGEEGWGDPAPTPDNSTASVGARSPRPLSSAPSSAPAPALAPPLLGAGGASGAGGPASGLKIERRYTQPGQDVWETCEWELRTASIVGSDGTVVFEQKGVEIPKSWSQLATNVAVSKYFRGHVGTLEREYSIKQLIGRVADRISEWGRQGGYFATDSDAEAFHDELRYILLHQYAAFNSPVWFNLGWPGRRQAVSACYINEVDDTMEAILDLYKTEGMLFKDGSGSGLNLSPLRSSKERLEAGGKSSGPISFMKGLDASAGSIKSGGSCLAPWTRVYTERGPVAVSDLVGKDFIALSYDPPAGRYKAKRAQAWHAGTKRVVRVTTDKGQFDLSYDHPVRLADGRYVPCEELHPGQALFHCKVDEQAGYVRVGLRRGHRDSEHHRKMHQLIAEDVLGWDTAGASIHHRDGDKSNNACGNLELLAQAEHAGLHGRLQAAQGAHLFQTQKFGKAGGDNPMHADSDFWKDEERVQAYRDRQSAHMPPERARRMHGEAVRVKMLNLGYAILSQGHPVDTLEDYYRGRLKIGRRCGSKRQFEEDVARHFGSYQEFVQELGRHNHRVVSVESLGVMDVYDVEVDCPTADDKSPQTGHNFVIWPDDSRFGTGIAVANTRRAACMRVLDIGHPDVKEFIDCKKDAEEKAHALIDAGYSGAFNVPGGAYDTVPFQNANHSVRVTDDFMQAVETDSAWETKFVTSGKTAETYRARDLMRAIAEGTWVCGDPGMQYDTTMNDWHTCANTDRQYATNPCSEFSFLNSTACNLASLNLMKFRRPDAAFDTASFEHAVKIMITAQEMMVGFASYPTEKIEGRSHEFRPLGLGYANLGALLMAAGLPYDSDAGRAYAGAVTALMTGRAYHQSAVVARDCGGPFAGYPENRAPMLRVIGKHRAAVDEINPRHIPDTLLSAARRSWDDALAEGEQSGYRNAQASVLAPTGTIGFLLDCDTTGIEPDIAIVKYKSLVGGGMMKIVNQTVPEALARLGYSDDQVKSIIAFIDENDTIEGASELKPEHLPIFDCAFRPMNGTRSIHYRGHIKMMAAAQPFISGAISKTVNVPTDATPDDIAETYVEAWKLGIKAVAIYRDGSKRTQPLNTSKETPKADKEGAATVVEVQEIAPPQAVRHRLPNERASLTHKFSIGGHEGYLTIGMYPDTGKPGEIFIRMSKEGSSISGLMDSFATAISMALQYGVPLQTLVDKFIHSRFEPSGFTGNKEIPMAKSIMDYMFRYMALKFLAKDERRNVGLLADQEGYGEDASAPPTKSPANGSGTNGHKNGNGTNGTHYNGTVATKPVTDVAHVAANATAQVAEHDEHEIFRAQSDAPPCPECGAITIRSGACYKCLSCGTSLGCS